MVYLRIAAFPRSGSDESTRFGSAIVNAWIKRKDIDEAISVARRMIAERGWYSEEVEDARFASREEFPEKSRDYFDQAEVDSEVLVFYTAPRDEAEGK